MASLTNRWMATQMAVAASSLLDVISANQSLNWTLDHVCDVGAFWSIFKLYYLTNNMAAARLM